MEYGSTPGYKSTTESVIDLLLGVDPCSIIAEGWHDGHQPVL
jgi:hypothetical protein